MGKVILFYAKDKLSVNNSLFCFISVWNPARILHNNLCVYHCVHVSLSRGEVSKTNQIHGDSRKRI